MSCTFEKPKLKGYRFKYGVLALCLYPLYAGTIIFLKMSNIEISKYNMFRTFDEAYDAEGMAEKMCASGYLQSCPLPKIECPKECEKPVECPK